MLLLVDMFKKNEYPTLDMASILKTTSTVGAKALKLSSCTAKEVRGRLECLSKDYAGKGIEEEVPPMPEKGKEKATDEP